MKENVYERRVVTFLSCRLQQWANVGLCFMHEGSGSVGSSERYWSQAEGSVPSPTDCTQIFIYWTFHQD